MPGIVAGTAIYIFRAARTVDRRARHRDAAGIRARARGADDSVDGAAVGASLVGVDQSIEEAAANLGARPFTTFRRVTLPMIRPGVVAAGIFTFIVSFTDLEMSLFLVGPGRSTLQIAMLQYLEWKFDPTVAAVSVVQIGIIGVGLVVTDRFVKLSKVV